MTKNIFWIRSNKAQASAPFEVLVAVILMGFVIMAGTWALINLNQSVCVGNKKQSMSEIKGLIEDVVLGSDLAEKNVKFDIQPCFNEKFEKITIKTYSNETLCNAFCNSGDTCTLMEYVYDDNKTRKVPIPPMCFNLPTSINYANIGSCVISEDEQENWTVMTNTTLSSNLTSGSYKIFMKSPTASDNVRELCFLKKVK